MATQQKISEQSSADATKSSTGKREPATETADASDAPSSASATPTTRGSGSAVGGQTRTIQRRPINQRIAPTPLPETVKFSIDLPPQVHEAPEHELAVAIHHVPVDPTMIDPSEPTTTTVLKVVATVESPALTAQSGPLSETATTTGPQEIIPLPGDGSRVVTRSVVVDTPPALPDPATAETSAMLTNARLINVRRKRRPAPEGFWPELAYRASAHLINVGDSTRVRERKALDARINKQFEGGTRFIPVFTRKGGVGKTTVTTLLGMAMASVRDDRVIAIDANPDRGTLAERITKTTHSTVRDVVRQVKDIYGFTDFSEMVSRDETRLDVLASDTDPRLSAAFDDDDYNIVADQAAKYYSVALTDCGTGIVHSVMTATLKRADAVVIVSGGSVDEARLASETLTWLESNGYPELARNAVVAINTATHATTLVKLEEIEAHFNSRVRAVVRMPYDQHLAAGSIVNYKDLRPLTRSSARDLAALVMDGLPVRRDSMRGDA
ncbi:MAG TPA: MinD/ParA family protein [Galbitalea sp.]|nr:MinD/ParA family protein [Galbitalea sp.]